MARKVSSIGFMPAVESISRKFIPRKMTCANANATDKKPAYQWMGAMVVTKTNKYGDGARNYFVFRRNQRTSALTTLETAARTRFAAVLAAVNARMHNPATIAGDQAAFIAQRDLPGGVKSFKGYLWKICGDDYDDAHEQG